MIATVQFYSLQLPVPRPLSVGIKDRAGIAITARHPKLKIFLDSGWRVSSCESWRSCEKVASTSIGFNAAEAGSFIGSP